MQERVAVRAVVRGQRVLRHDFSGGGPCPVALRLAVRNCLGTPVSLSMEARPRQPVATPGGAPAPGTPPSHLSYLSRSAAFDEMRE